jgi:WD40 repeat protein
MGRTDLRGAHLTPNGQYLVVIGFRYMALHDVESGDVIYTKDRPGFAPTCAFSPGRVLMTEWSGGPGKFSLVETATGKPVAQLPGTDRGHCEGMSFSPDGRMLVLLQSGYRPGEGSKVDLIEIATGKVLKSITAHRDKVRAAAFTPGGRALITGSDDCSVLVWDLTGVLAPEKKIDVKVCWDEMAKSDRRTAYVAFCRLRTVPDETVPFLKKELATAAPDAELEKLRRIWAIRLLEDLNSAAAREVLQDLAPKNSEAQAALKRLKRSDTPP